MIAEFYAGLDDALNPTWPPSMFAPRKSIGKHARHFFLQQTP